MVALDKEEGKVLVTSSNSWYKLINLFFFLFFFLLHALYLSTGVLEILGCKVNKRILLSFLQCLSETYATPSLPASTLSLSSTSCVTKASQMHPTAILLSTGLQLATQSQWTPTRHNLKDTVRHGLSSGLQSQAAQHLETASLQVELQPALTRGREAAGSSYHQCPHAPPLPSLAQCQNFTTMGLPAKRTHTQPLGAITARQDPGEQDRDQGTSLPGQGEP